MTREQFWLQDPMVLINPLYLHRFFPTESLNNPEKMNAIMRATIYISIALVLYTGDWRWLFLIILSAMITAGYAANSLEGFRDWIRVHTSSNTMEILKTPNLPNHLEMENPYMDYLVKELVKHPGRSHKHSSHKKQHLSTKESSSGKEGLLYQDINDVYQKTQSQRSFAGTPGVNDQSEFARYLGYDSMRSCRDSSDQEQCYRGY
jgi:hypothetical protein